MFNLVKRTLTVALLAGTISLPTAAGALAGKNNTENVSIPQHAIVTVQVTSARRQSS